MIDISNVYNKLDAQFSDNNQDLSFDTILEAALLDPMVKDSLTDNPDGKLIVDSVKRMAERMESSDEKDDDNKNEDVESVKDVLGDIMKLLTQSVTSGAISESVLESVVGSLTYYCVRDGIADEDVLTTANTMNETEGNRVFYSYGTFPGGVIQEERAISKKSDLITFLFDHGYYDNYSIEEYAKSVFKDAETKAHQAMSILGVPLNKTERNSPYLSPAELGLSEGHLLSLSKDISKSDKLETNSIVDILNWIQPDLTKVVKEPVGDYEANSVIGTFVTFIAALLYGIFKSPRLTFPEMMPVYRYVREELFTLNRMENRYFRLALIATNACCGLIEWSMYGRYGDTTVVAASSTLNQYDNTELNFKSQGVNRHGVPDDMYSMMLRFTKSTVIPEEIRNLIKDEKLYPTIGPVRLLFNDEISDQFVYTKAETSALGSQPLVSSVSTLDPECNRMLKKLLDSVDQESLVSCDSVAVDAGSKDSGEQVTLKSYAQTKVDDIMRNIGVVTTGVQNMANVGRANHDVESVSTAICIEQMILSLCGDKKSNPTVSVAMETLGSDIVRNNEWIDGYKRSPIYAQAIKDAETRAIAQLEAML